MRATACGSGKPQVARSGGNFSYVWFRLSLARQWNNAHCSIPVPATWLEIGNEGSGSSSVFRGRKVQAAGKLLKNRRNSARAGGTGTEFWKKAAHAFSTTSKVPRFLQLVSKVFRIFLFVIPSKWYINTEINLTIEVDEETVNWNSWNFKKKLRTLFDLKVSKFPATRF